MADPQLREAFNDCIDRIASGQTVNDCLRAHPEYATVLRPMLEVGGLVDRAQANAYEVAAAQARVRAQLRTHMQARPTRRSYGYLVALAASLLLIFVAVFGAAENSLPGDPLYQVKRFTENARTTLIGQQFAGRRVDEILALEALKRPASVEFEGVIEQRNGTQWRIAGLDVQVAAGITGADAVGVGDRVHVSAYTTDQGDLIATSLTPLETISLPPNTTETITPEVTPTPEPTSTPTPSVTPSPVATTCTPTLPAGWVSYVVQSGDTVSGLAAVTGASVDELLTVNCLPQTRMIIVGQRVYLPMQPQVQPLTTTLTSAPSMTEAPTMEPSADNPPQATLAPTDDHHSGEDNGSHSSGDD